MSESQVESQVEFWRISSNDKLKGMSATNADFKVDLPDKINGKRVKLLYISLPKTYFNITNFNNSITTSSMSILITPGNYSLSELIAKIIVEMDVHVAGTGLLYDDVLNVFKLSNPSPFSVSFTKTSIFHNIFGFDGNFSANTVHQSNTEPQFLNGNVYISIKQFKSMYSSSLKTHDFTFVCPDAAFQKSENVYFRHKEMFDQITTVLNQPSYLNIQLTSDNGELLEAVSDWTMLFETY
jgi:hypothetical protein